MAIETAPPRLSEPGEQGSFSQIRLQFTTRDPDILLPKNTGSILVSTDLRRFTLSRLINELLQPERPIPLEFLINGTLLRTNIDDYLTANGISPETTLNVEYVRAIVPPLYQASYEHDAWVSSVDVLSSTSAAGSWAGHAAVPPQGQGRILSGSYDGLLRVWSMSSQILATSPTTAYDGHAFAIKSTKFLSPTQIVSSGDDRTVRIWNYSEAVDKLSAQIQPYLELHGHIASVNYLSVHLPSNRILSASSDRHIGIWSTKKSESPAAPSELIPSAASGSSKRQKVTASTSTPRRGPLALLKSHTDAVTSTIFAPNDPTVAYSSSLDHTLRTWDLPTQSLVDTRTTSHPLVSLTALVEHNLIAAGTTARHITLIDPRVSAVTTSAVTLRGHINAVSSLAPNPHSSYGLISGSHDGSCRIWDIRSTKSEKEGLVGHSMYTILRESEGEGTLKRVGGEGVKVFDVAWDREVGIISGSEDKRVQINSGKGIVGTESK